MSTPLYGLPTLRIAVGPAVGATYRGLTQPAASAMKASSAQARDHADRERGWGIIAVSAGRASQRRGTLSSIRDRIVPPALRGARTAMDLLKGKVAVITGASKGIGRVMSRLFAAEGAAVVCAARSGALVQETAALITKDGGKAVAVTADAAKEADVKRMVTAGLQAFGKIDTLVNNAGDGGPTKPVQEYTEE